MGKKNRPVYRIVAVEKRSKRNGRYIEALGYYDPMTEPFKFELDKEKFDNWIKKGAIISEGLQKLLNSRSVKNIRTKK